MFLEPHQGQAGISAGKLLDLKQWQKIQNLFAEIIGANLWLIEPTGTSFTISSQVTPSCSNLAVPIEGVQNSKSNCVWKAFQNMSDHHGMVYHCPHRLSYFLIPIRCEDETVGVLVVGPILLGKREDQKTNDDLAKTLGVDHEVFSDRIREIKVFSHHGIRIVLEFLEELVHHLVREAY
ncbi:MAG: PocR ligand-binding domain-containing protein, partial [Candidatus Omnitrophica bacterium]|nr:PocR ligand-binding domain-containing protein [Candidatus Omnitrophota bacterium]